MLIIIFGHFPKSLLGVVKCRGPSDSILNSSLTGDRALDINAGCELDIASPAQRARKVMGSPPPPPPLFVTYIQLRDLRRTSGTSTVRHLKV